AECHSHVRLQQWCPPSSARDAQGCDRSERDRFGGTLRHLAETPAGAAGMRNLLALILSVIAFSAGALAQSSTAQPAAWSRMLAGPQDRGTAAERGAAVFNNWCSACHGKDPRNAPGTASLQFKYQGRTPAALEERRDLTPQAIRLFVRQGVATMPFSRKTEVSDADLEALTAYLTQPKP